MFFKSDRPACNHLNVNFIQENLSKNNCFLKKKSIVCIFNPKDFEVKENCSEILLNDCPLKCTYIGKNHFNFISIWSAIMSLKSDRLELGYSTYARGNPSKYKVKVGSLKIDSEYSGSEA